MLSKIIHFKDSSIRKPVKKKPLDQEDLEDFMKDCLIECAAHLQARGKKFYIPTMSEYNEFCLKKKGYPTASQIAAVLGNGNFPAAREAAGLDTDDLLLELLREVADEVAKKGRLPIQTDLERYELPGLRKYLDRWGTWKNTLEQIGIITNYNMRKRYSDQQLLNNYIKALKRCGGPPSIKIMNQIGPSYAVFCKRLNVHSWHEVHLIMEQKIKRLCISGTKGNKRQRSA